MDDLTLVGVDLGKHKEKRVPGDTFAPMPAHSFPPARQFAPVFKHALTRRERPRREHIFPVTDDRRTITRRILFLRLR